MELSKFVAHLRGFSEYLQRVGTDLFREAFRIHQVRDLTVQQLRYLEVIEGKPGTTPGDLAALFGVRKPTVSNIIRQLESAGLIDREAGPADRRTSHLYPTGTTTQIFEKRREMYTYLASHIQSRLTAFEMQQLMELFDKASFEKEGHDA